MPVLIQRRPVQPESISSFGKTRDISTQGLYFTISEPLTLSTQFQFTLELPAEITGGVKVLIVAEASVVRVEIYQQEGVEKFGIGASIDKFDIVRVLAAPAL